ncbi:MAG: RNA polymerase sigma factor [Actinomycetota bacterium]
MHATLMMATVKERAIDEPPVDEQAIDAETDPVRADAPARHDFERVYRDHGPGLFRAIYAYTGGRRDIADEVVSESFARAIAHDADVREPVPYVYRTAFRLAAKELRAERRRPPLEPEVPADPPDVAGLLAALRRLSPNQRAAIVLRYEADLPVEEVARRMGITAVTVRVHVHRGRTKLRELLGAEEVDES